MFGEELCSRHAVDLPDVSYSLITVTLCDITKGTDTATVNEMFVLVAQTDTQTTKLLPNNSFSSELTVGSFFFFCRKL